MRYLPLLNMPIHLAPHHIIDGLHSPQLHGLVQELVSAGHIGNERTLQAYIWNHLLEKTIHKRHTGGAQDGQYVYYQDYILEVELYDNDGHYPDLSFRNRNDLNDIFFAIEIKHHPSHDALSEREIQLLKQDLTNLIARDSPGALIFTCPLEELYTETIDALNHMTDDSVTVVTIECR